MSKEIKTLADLEALEPRERDVWFYYKLTGREAERIKSDGLDVLICPEVKYDYVTPLIGKEINDIALMLLGGAPSGYKYITRYTTTFDGLFAIKAAMVKRGYDWSAEYISELFCPDTEYFCEFSKNHAGGGAWGKTEIEATWKAAAKALLGE